jgi:predicted aldo/keto reductase-like oxidoreductase
MKIRLCSPVGTWLTDVSKFVYGTTRLGDETIAFDARVGVARAAMQAGVWFHTSHSYGGALQVLRAAFDRDRNYVPSIIFKIGFSTMGEVREVIQKHLDALSIDHMDIGQLCLRGQLADEFRAGGKCYGEFRRLRDEGLVRRFVIEVFPWTSQASLEALRAGYTAGIVDGYIFYLNPLQRFASNELWDILQERDEPIIAMRTMSGGPVHHLQEVAGDVPREYLRQRAREVAPIFERSGAKSWAEFCVRFIQGFPQVRATVGSTARLEHLQQLLSANRDTRPLPEEIHSQIVKLQYYWSDEIDMRAEPWSM